MHVLCRIKTETIREQFTLLPQFWSDELGWTDMVNAKVFPKPALTFDNDEMTKGLWIELPDQKPTHIELDKVNWDTDKPDYTVVGFWDCECIGSADQYINPGDLISCPDCGAHKDESPDSFLSELLTTDKLNYYQLKVIHEILVNDGFRPDDLGGLRYKVETKLLVLHKENFE